jgi:hypothetical protein
MSNGPRQGNRLRTVGTLLDSHLGRTVTVTGLTGSLAGVVPLGPTVQLSLIVGGARVFTDRLTADTDIEIHQKETTP